MPVKNNISKLKDCYGCGVCVKACPVNIIALRQTDKGFYAPAIDNPDRCIECGLCLNICAYAHNNVSAPIHSDNPDSYAAWSDNQHVREWCSSGGVGFEIGKALIERGYKAVGVRYDPSTLTARHYIASSAEEFMASTGSKYIQSYTADAFLQLDKKQKYLVTGTPCQIDSLRRYARQSKTENNFVFLDFFCHGVPSWLMWQKYEKQYIQDSVGHPGFVSWRNKRHGWHDSWVMSADPANSGSGHDIYAPEPEHALSSRMSQGDLFYKFFLGHYCLNHCCHTACKYKMLSSAADIRIGDLWGKSYEENEKGVNALLVFSDRGREVAGMIENTCTLIPEPIESVTEGQMRACAPMPRIRDKVLDALAHQSLKQVNDSLIRRYELTRLPQRAWRRLKRICKK